MNRIPFLGLACWLIAAASIQAAPSDPAQLQSEAYFNQVQADQHFDAGRLDEALSLYQQARDDYAQLAKDFPDWEPRIVELRKNDCELQMAAIQQRKSGESADAPAIPDNSPPAMDLVEMPEAESARADVPAAGNEAPLETIVEPKTAEEKALDSPPAERVGKNKKRQSADKEQEPLRRQLEQAEESIRNLQAEAANKDAKAQEMDAARAAESDALRKELDSARQQIEELQKDAAGKSLRALRAELADANKKLQASDKESKRLLKQLEKSETALQRLQAEQADQEAKAKERDAARAAESEQLQSRIAGLEAERVSLSPTSDAAQALAADNEALRAKLDSAKQQLDERQKDAESSLQALRAELDGKANESKELEKTNRQLLGQQGTDQVALQDLRDQLAAKEQRMAGLQEELEGRKKLDSALKQAEKEAAKLRDEIERLNQKTAVLDAAREAAEFRADLAETKTQQIQAKLKDAEPKPLSERAAPAVAAAAPAKAESVPRPAPGGTHPADHVRRLMQNGDDRAALATVQEARRSDPADMHLGLLEGAALIRLRLYPEAVALLSEFARTNPRHAEVFAALGAAQIGTGSYEEARQNLLNAIRLDQDLPESHFNLAQIFARVEPKDLEQARQHYRKAIELGLAPSESLEQALKAF